MSFQLRTNLSLFLLATVILASQTSHSQELYSSTSETIQATAFVIEPAGLVKLTDFKERIKIKEFNNLLEATRFNTDVESQNLLTNILVYHPPYYKMLNSVSTLESPSPDLTKYSYFKSTPYIETKISKASQIITLIYTEN